MTASVFAVTKGRYQLLGGKPTLKKVHVLCWRVDNLFVQRDLFVKLITCTVVVHDGGVERLNICWICFDDLVMNKTANVTNICLEFLLSNCVPRTIGVPRKKKKKIHMAAEFVSLGVGIYSERVLSLITRVCSTSHRRYFKTVLVGEWDAGGKRTLSTIETTHKRGQDMRKIICMLTHYMPQFVLKITTVKFYQNV